MHNSMVVFTFSALDQKNPFLTNLAQNPKLFKVKLARD